jgi:hypothetical protein
MFALALAPAGLLLWAATDPNLYYILMEWLMSALACLAVGMIHGVWFAIRWTVVSAHAQPRSMVWPDGRRWRALWALVLAAVLLVVMKVPLYAGFLVSRTALEALRGEAGAALAAAGATAPVRWAPVRATPSTAGIHQVTSVDFYGDALMFRVGGEGGFAHSPNGESEIAYNAGQCGRLWGDWYWFSED